MRRRKLEEDQVLGRGGKKVRMSEVGFERSEFAQLLFTTSRET